MSDERQLEDREVVRSHRNIDLCCERPIPSKWRGKILCTKTEEKEACSVSRNQGVEEERRFFWQPIAVFNSTLREGSKYCNSK